MFSPKQLLAGRLPQLGSLQSRLCALSVALGACVLMTSGAHAAEYHVTSASQLQSTLQNLSAGDTMFIGPGDYYPAIAQSPYNHLLMDARSGTSSNWITIRNEPGQAKPRIFLGGDVTNGFTIRYSNYVRVAGLEIVGVTAANNKSKGLYIENSHHVQVTNCVIRDAGGDGLSMVNVSQVLIENNVCHGNAKKAAYGPSGISIYHPSFLSTDNTGFAGPQGNPNNYAIIVRGNTCYDNIKLNTTNPTNELIDGNGIIIDDFQGTQNGTYFSGKTLVANNVCYYNGARGIHIFSSDNTDVFNNTVYKNQRNINEAEIANYGSNNRYFNNIIYSDNKVGTRVAGAVNNNLQWGNNLYFNDTARVAGTNDKVGQDPKFVSPGTTGSANFKLQSTSPAINASGTTSVTTDRDRHTRIGTPDIGAYEVVNIPLGKNIAFKAVNNGKYVWNNNSNSSNYIQGDTATSVGSWERFRLVDAGGGQVALLSLVNNKYVTCNLNNSQFLQAHTATTIGSWEKFQYIVRGPNKFTLIAANSEKYVSNNLNSTPARTLQTFSPYWNNIGTWEEFDWQELAATTTATTSGTPTTTATTPSGNSF